MRVEFLNQRHFKAWDNFLEQDRLASFTGLTGFIPILKRHFKLKPRHVIVLNPDNDIIAALPLATKSNGEHSNRYLRTPALASFGGFVFKDGISDIEKAFVARNIFKFFVKNEVKQIKISGSNYFFPGDIIDSPQREPHFYKVALMDLGNDETQVFNNLHRSVRKAVRKAKRSGLHCKILSVHEALKGFFYEMYVSAMKKFGTPPLSIGFFEDLTRLPDHRFKIFTILKGARVAAYLFVSVFTTRVELFLTLSDETLLGYRPNELAHWEVIRWAISHKKKYVVFGLIKYDGQERYKSKWNVEKIPIFDYKVRFKNNKSPIVQYCPFISENNFSVRIGAFFFQHLPITISTRLGPFVRKTISR